MAGLTLIYCAWVNPELIYNSTTSNDIYACSIVLFVITERWPGARKYRDAFDIIKQNVIDRIAAGRHIGPRQTVVELKNELQSTLSTLHNLQGDEDQQYECTRIITDMAGEPMESEVEIPGSPATRISRAGADELFADGLYVGVLDGIYLWK